MWAALGWGALAASSLVGGVLLGLVRAWPKRLVGLVLAFGAGALIASVAFELAEKGLEIGGPAAVAIGLAVGALAYYLLDGAIERDGQGPAGGSGAALALGAVLDGIPEQLVLGIGLAAGSEISVGLLVAVFVSNLPEATGSATQMRAAGHSASSILRLWLAVTLVCALTTVVGHALADVTSGFPNGVINGFAAGATLVMLIDSMIPTAAARAGRVAGLATVLGFAISAGLSTLSA